MPNRTSIILNRVLISLLIMAPTTLVWAQGSGREATASINQQRTLPTQTLQVAELGKLWARLRWVHPALAEGKIDWDKQLLDALPDAAKAASPEAQQKVVRKMLACLNDPALRVGPPIEQAQVEPSEGAPRTSKLVDNILLISLNDPGITPFSGGAFKAEVNSAKAAIATAEGLIFDLRPSKDAAFIDATDFLKGILGGLLVKPLDPPSTRFIYNRGWPSQSFSTTGGYYTAWMTQHSAPLKAEPGGRPVPMVFIVDAATLVPAYVLALQKAGLAFILAVGDAPNLWMPVETRPFGSFEVTYRSGEIVFPDGTIGYGPDQVIPANTRLGPGSPALQAALALLKSGKKPGNHIVWRTASVMPIRDGDKPYVDMVNPDLAWRQFAVIRFWSVIEAFFPYKDLMDRSWAEALPEFLAEMEQVQDGDDYAKCLARMAALLQDNHVGISGHPFFARLRGEAGLPVVLRMVEHSVLIDEIVDAQAARGLNKWDELLAIDGEAVRDFMKGREPYVSAANAWTMDRNLVIRMGRGQDGSVAKLKVKGADGAIREVNVARSKAYSPAWPKTLHKGEIIQVLPGMIGYVDLGRLLPSQVEELFVKVKDTKGLILDMRGYPNGTAWSLASRLNTRGAVYAASISPMTISSAESEFDSEMVTGLQTLPRNNGKPIYQGKVVMLIDEMTQSQAEHSGLFFEAACGVTFIGSPTAGSNGDVTDLLLPGGIKVSFTGQGVKHADGRQLQRVGLQPKILVRPTVQGVRGGKDEVMDQAILFLRDWK